MQVGLLFRKETITAYRRIQDIHLTSNVIQRWLGIASISIQTASGSAMPEIIIEGVSEPEKLRDWLYARLRGARTGSPVSSPSNSLAAIDGSPSESDPSEITRLLTDIRDNLAAMANRDHRGES
jgi:putative membrane protein